MDFGSSTRASEKSTRWKGMERLSCLIRLLGMMTFQVRLYATEFP